MPDDLPLERVAGLTIDAWDEVIPSRQTTAGAAFHYNQPNAFPPQSLLLAVPGQISEEDSEWTEDALLGIVNDTLDLAKIRAVDPDALHGMVGNLLPALAFKTSTDLIDRDGVREWLNAETLVKTLFEGRVISTISGKVLEIASEMQSVKPGDKLAKIKGEEGYEDETIWSYWSGTVTSVEVSEGSSVDRHDLLMTVD